MVAEMPSPVRRRRRRIRIAALLGSIAVLLVVWIVSGSRLVPQGGVGLLDSPARSSRALGPGRHWAAPLIESITLLDPFVRDGTLTYTTPEGARLDLELHVALRLSPAGASELLQTGHGARGLARVTDAIDRLLLERIGETAEDWNIPRIDTPLLDAVTATLARFGEIEGKVELAFREDSPVTLARREAELWSRVRSERPDTGTRILLVGLDGADWQLADPLIERGLLPNLARLRDRGAWGNLKTLTPILSPLLWTSVATGVTADRHGVLDFLIRDPASGALVPVNGGFRRVRALWNLFSDAGLRTDVIAWWATWPAEHVNGHVISDRVAYSLFDFDLPTGGNGATYPAEELGRLRPLIERDDAVPFELIRRFVDVDRQQIEQGRARIVEDPRQAYREPVNHLSKILASTRSYHRIALRLLREGQADLTAVYYEAIDEVCHRFMHFMPPRLDGIDPEDVRRYGRAVEAMYIYQDQLLGELLEAAAPDTTVIVLSDHGFVNGADRPAGQTADIEGRPGRWHRPYGMLILAGPPIEPGRLDTTSLLDIAPTVLRLGGLPVPDDLDGRVLDEAIRPAFRERFPGRHVATYEISPFRIDAAPRSDAVAAAEAEIVESLRALGYVDDSDETPSTGAPTTGSQDGHSETMTLTAHVNLAAVLLAAGRLDPAETEIRAALAMNPSFPVALRQLFSLRVRQGRGEEALTLVPRLLEAPDDLDERLLTRIADTYRDAGRAEDGIRQFREQLALGHASLGAPLARLLLDSGDVDGADRLARGVLDRDATNRSAMLTVFRVARSRGRLGNVQPLLEAALAVNPRSLMHLNWLAIVEESAGHMDRAEQLMLQALETHPDHGGSMVNLGGFYLRHERADDAVRLLQRALRIDPGNVEARINLGSALAATGMLDDAIAEFEEVVEQGDERAAVLNALARACAQTGRLAEARDWLERSLEIDPGQEAVRDALARVEARLP